MIKNKNRKINVIINLCVIFYLVIATILNMSNTIKIEGTEFLDVIGRDNYFQIALGWLFMFVISFIGNITNWIIMGIFISIKLGVKNSKKGIWIWEDADFYKYKGYYRDVLKQYSPLVLSYVDNFKLDNRDIVATLLNAKLKNNENLTKTEKYVIENKENINFEYLKRIVSKEASENGLLKNTESYYYESNNQKKKTIIDFIKFIISICVLIFIFSLVKFYPTNVFMLDCLIIISGCVAIYLLYVITIILLRFISLLFFALIELITRLGVNVLKVHIIRTAKGNEINQKLEGLKNYIKHYTVLGERELKELELWEEYLIYSVMFGINKKAIDSFTKN